MLTTTAWTVKPNARNRDLLLQLHSLVQQAGTLCKGVVKITSHQEHHTLTPVEQWACRGNDTADATAAMAIRADPYTFHLHQQLVEECREMSTLISAFHATIIAIGLRAMKTTSAKRTQEPIEPIEETVQMTLDHYTPWVFPQALPPEASRYANADWPCIFRWIQSLQGGDRVQHWSWFQLYADFQLRNPGKGPWYKRKKNTWEAGWCMPREPFAQRCRWMSTFLTGLARTLNIALPWGKFQPTSHVLAFWTNGLQVKVDRQRQLDVDNWFAEFRPVYRKSTDIHVLL